MNTHVLNGMKYAVFLQAKSVSQSMIHEEITSVLLYVNITQLLREFTERLRFFFKRRDTFISKVLSSATASAEDQNKSFL